MGVYNGWDVVAHTSQNKCFMHAVSRNLGCMRELTETLTEIPFSTPLAYPLKVAELTQMQEALGEGPGVMIEACFAYT